MEKLQEKIELEAPKPLSDNVYLGSVQSDIPYNVKLIRQKWDLWTYISTTDVGLPQDPEDLTEGGCNMERLKRIKETCIQARKTLSLPKRN